MESVCKLCKKCNYPVCGDICEHSETHGRECLVLKNIRLKEKNYAVVSVVRLLLLKYHEEDWKVVGKQTNLSDKIYLSPCQFL